MQSAASALIKHYEEANDVRLDKFLKVSRLVKRRTVANELCDGGHAQVNGKTAKPSTEVVIGDMLRLRFGNRVVSAQILEIPIKIPAVQDAARLYHLLSENTAPSSL